MQQLSIGGQAVGPGWSVRVLHPAAHGSHGEQPTPGCSSFPKNFAAVQVHVSAAASFLPPRESRTLLLGKMSSFRLDVCGVGCVWERMISGRRKEWHPIPGETEWPVTGSVGWLGILVLGWGIRSLLPLVVRKESLYAVWGSHWWLRSTKADAVSLILRLACYYGTKEENCPEVAFTTYWEVERQTRERKAKESPRRVFKHKPNVTRTFAVWESVQGRHCCMHVGFFSLVRQNDRWGRSFWSMGIFFCWMGGSMAGSALESCRQQLQCNCKNCSRKIHPVARVVEELVTQGVRKQYSAVKMRKATLSSDRALSTFLNALKGLSRATSFLET